MIPSLHNSIRNTNISFEIATALTSVRLMYEQSGPVIIGPGSLRKFKLFKLSILDVDQVEAIERAKRFAFEQSIKSALEKQTSHISHLPTKTIQTLSLLSRIYIGSIAYDIKEEALKKVFCQFGLIKSVNLSWDASNQKHKGFAFLEFEYPESAYLAIEQVNSINLSGRQLKIGRPSNLLDAGSLIEEMISKYNLQRRIFICGVHSDLSEEDVILVFEAFGKIQSCKLSSYPNSSHKHRGFGFIEYECEQSAIEAISNMNMFDLGGQLLRVCKSILPPNNGCSTNGKIPTAAAVAAASVTAKVIALEAENVSRTAALGVESSTVTVSDIDLSNILQPKSRIHFDSCDKASHTPARFNEMEEQPIQNSKSPLISNGEEEGSLENQENIYIRGHNARNLITQKLLRSMRGVMILRNMIGPEDECDENLVDEITEECCNYGQVEKVYIHQMNENYTPDKNLDHSHSSDVKIFVVYNDSNCLSNAVRSLNGRYFAGRLIQADHYDLTRFESNDFTG